MPAFALGARLGLKLAGTFNPERPKTVLSFLLALVSVGGALSNRNPRSRSVRAVRDGASKEGERYMRSGLGLIAYLVREYDEAIAYFTEVLGFTLIEDTPLTDTKRWVVVAPPGGEGANLLLARAVGPEQEARVGDQTGGRVFLFLCSDDFDRDHRAMTERGVTFVQEPRTEEYGRVCVFEDLYGHRWDLLQLNAAAAK